MIETLPPTVTVPGETRAVNDPNADPEDFFSAHTGVCLFLFADGSVRPLTQGVKLSILQALATRAGGEVVSGGDF